MQRKGQLIPTRPADLLYLYRRGVLPDPAATGDTTCQ